MFAPFLNFNTFDLSLGININIIQMMNQQPIRLLCKSRSRNIPFFYVEFMLCKSDGSIYDPSEDELKIITNMDGNMKEQAIDAEMKLLNLSSKDSQIGLSNDSVTC